MSDTHKIDKSHPFYKKLSQNLEGEAYIDSVHRGLYSIDASIFEVLPMAVVVPKSEQDLYLTFELAKEYALPIIPRGAATSTTGAALGEGIVIDCTKYLNRILSFDQEQESVWVEPGVVQDQLNDFLSDFGYRLGPDTSSGSRATIGGMIGNNSSGARSLKYGTTWDAVDEVELLLSTNEVIHLKALNENELDEKLRLNNQEGLIYQSVQEVLCDYKTAIEQSFPKLQKQASGYLLDKLMESSPFNLSKLIVGSEGTLGFTQKAKLKLIKKSAHLGLAVLQFSSLSKALELVPELLSHKPLSLELIDHHLIDLGKKAPTLQGSLSWLKQGAQAVILFEQEADLSHVLKTALEKLSHQLKHTDSLLSFDLAFNDDEQAKIWNFRKMGLSLLTSQKAYQRGYAFIEDLIVPPEELPNFVKELNQYLSQLNKQAGIYGHVGAGLIHVRPFINLRDKHDLALIPTMLEKVTKIVIRHKGSLTGEHGDGLIRSYLLKDFFGSKVLEAFYQVKQAFDPDFRMNPNKIIGNHLPTKSLRMDPTTSVEDPVSFLDFSQEGGLSLAVDLCNGNGLCRKKSPSMCPSYQACLDEKHSTRARAQLLRRLSQQKLSKSEGFSQEAMEVFELCIECKSCKYECPSSVDIAKLKAEFLYQYYQHKNPSLKHYLFAHFDTLTRLMSPFSRIINPIQGHSFLKPLLSYLGIASDISLPKLASFRFSNWFQKNYRPPSHGAKKVAIFSDSYTEFYRPQLGIAATEVLAHFGFHVHLIPWSCCGRPAFSKGFLDHAKANALTLHSKLQTFVDQQIPIIVLEPSCHFTIKDDYASLIRQDTSKLSENLFSLEAFLSYSNTPLKASDFHNLEKSYAFHVHCHEKQAYKKNAYLAETLAHIPGVTLKTLSSGCCGMAGSFGYEKAYRNISTKIFEQQVDPHLNHLAPEYSIISNGFSCQHQFAHLKKYPPLHSVQVLHQHLKKTS